MNEIDERNGWTSASNAMADSLCPGRHIKQRGIPDTESDDAQFGDNIHRALKDGDGSKLTPEEFDVFEACQRIEADCVGKFFGGDKLAVWREQRYWARIRGEGGGELMHSGQPDVVYRSGSVALILEYKTLPGQLPSAPSNMQLRDQVVLVHGNLPLLAKIGAAVIQPLVTSTPELCVYEKEHVIRAEQEMFQRVAISNNPSAPRVAGEAQCKYCKAKRVCVEYQRFAGALVPGMLSLLDVPVSAWTPEQRAAFCDRKSVAQKWLDEMEAQVKAELAKDPEAVPGWFLKPGRIIETIRDPQAVFDRFAGIGGNLENFMACIAVGKSKLRDQLSKVTGNKGKALDAQLKTLTQDLVEIKQAAPSLFRKEAP